MNIHVFFVITIVLVHRLIAILIAKEGIIALCEANPDWLTWQFLLPNALQEHLLQSILYLQQSPPIPNVLLGIFVKIFGWPYGAAFACIALCGILSSISAGLFVSVARRMQFGPIIGSGIAILLFLSFDVFGLEYNSLGQTFYEFLAMTFMLAATLAYQRFAADAVPAKALNLGIFIGLLALSRSGLHLIFVPTLLLILLVASKHRRANAVAFILAIAVLQGGWSVKNFLVFDYLSTSTSTWTGANLVAGLQKAGYEAHLNKFAKRHKNTVPSWVAELIAAHGIATWHPAVAMNFAPAEVRTFDTKVSESVAGTNRSENSLSQKQLFDAYVPLYFAFVKTHPRIFFRKFARSYVIFWQPIRNYLRQFLAVYSTPVVLTTFSEVLASPGILLGSAKTDVQMMKGTYRDRTYIETGQLSLVLPGLLLLGATFVLAHVFVVVYFCAGVLFFFKGRSLRTQNLVPVFVAIQIAYVAVIFNITEFGENMRFRLMIEPQIYLASLFVIRKAVLHLRNVRKPF